MSGDARDPAASPTLVATGESADGLALRELARGDVIGRYVVVSRLGAGGMGVVHVAYDPELDRKVALKVLHADAREGSEGHSRLLREAQALAKLSHPNIVGVHDVGRVGERVWIAMELVSGKTLRQWLDERVRSWREVLAVMSAAGSGLAAAHAHGIVHRDFKPDNVMVADDGRVRVMDFGLARTQADPPASGGEALSRAPQTSALAVDLTTTGAVLGTPAYMAPEQHLGLQTDERSDQFGYCVATWEGLFGERPFAGRTVAELALAVTEGRRRAPAPGRRVPTWLRRAIERGLAADPEERHASMQALAHALERGRTRSRATRALVGIAAVAAVALSGYAVSAAQLARRVAACEAAGATITEVWNDDRRETLRAALVATGVSYADVTAVKVMPWLDAQAGAWDQARTQACLEAEVREQWDADTLDRSSWCLDERRTELEALVDELAHAEVRTVQRAVSAAAGLAPIGPCLDDSLLATQPTPPAHAREAIRELQRELASTDALLHAGRYQAGLDAVRALRERAVEADWPPLAIAVTAQEATLLGENGNYAEAARVGEFAYFDAARSGAWDLASSTAADLVAMVGDRLNRRDDGLGWARHAEVARAHAGDPLGLREAAAANNLGNLHDTAGEYAQARELHERAMSLWEHALGPEHPNLAMSLSNQATVALNMGDTERGAALYERALAIREASFGPEHPAVASSLIGLGATHEMLGRLPEARRDYERALAIYEKMHGPDHPDVAMAVNNLGIVEENAGELARALVLHERALAIYEKVHGPEHALVATSLANLASLRGVMGDHAAAAQLNRKAHAIFEKALGPDHPTVAAILVNVASGTQGEDPDEALRLLERAVAIFDRHDGAQPNEVTARMELAKALVATHGDRARALVLARSVRDEYAAQGAAAAAKLAEVDAWIAAQGQ